MCLQELEFLKRSRTIPIFKSGKDLFTKRTLPKIVSSILNIYGIQNHQFTGLMTNCKEEQFFPNKGGRIFDHLDSRKNLEYQKRMGKI